MAWLRVLTSDWTIEMYQYRVGSIPLCHCQLCHTLIVSQIWQNERVTQRASDTMGTPLCSLRHTPNAHCVTSPTLIVSQAHTHSILYIYCYKFNLKISTENTHDAIFGLKNSCLASQNQFLFWESGRRYNHWIYFWNPSFSIKKNHK